MNTLYQIMGLVAAGLLLWFLFRTIKGNPTAFSKENVNKSFLTMGLLALILIAFVAFLIFLLRMS